MQTSIVNAAEERIGLLLGEITKQKPDWKRVEDCTGVPAEKWRNLNRKLVAPSLEMLLALGAAFPQYAFWLVTGHVDLNNGHLAPKGATANEIKSVSTLTTAG